MVTIRPVADSRSDDRRLLALALLVSVLVIIVTGLRDILSPEEFPDDARQHVFWTYRFVDPEFFPDDPLVRFISSTRFDPWGYQAVFRLAAPILDPLVASKLLGVVLALGSTAIFFAVGRRIGGGPAGFFVAIAAAATLNGLCLEGLPRSFGVPLVAGGALAVMSGRVRLLSASLVAAALAYPTALLSIGGLLPAALSRGLRSPLRESGDLFLRILPGLALAAVILWVSYGVVDREFIGPMVTRDEARAMPEFGPHGRNRFFLDDPVAFFLGENRYSRSSLHLLETRRGILAGATILLLLLRRRRAVVPGIAAWMLISSLALFAAAHVLLFRLYLPSKYVYITIPAALAVILGATLGAAPRLSRLAAALARPRALATAAVIVTAAGIGYSLSPARGLEPDHRALIRYLRTLPKDVLLAGHPKTLDDVPLLCRRSVLANRELSLAWYRGHYDRCRERIEDSLRLLYAQTDAEVRAIRDRTGAYRRRITHAVVEKRWLVAQIAGRIHNPPFDALAETLRRRGPSVFAATERRPVFENDRYAVFDLSDW